MTNKINIIHTAMAGFLTMASLSLVPLSRVTSHISRIADGHIDTTVAVPFQMHQRWSKTAQQSSITTFLLTMPGVALPAAWLAKLKADAHQLALNDLQKIQKGGKTVKIAETGLHGQR